MVMDSLLYRPGDLVTIRSDLVGDRDYPVLYGPSAGKRTLYCNDSMVNYSGKPMKSRIMAMMMISIY